MTYRSVLREQRTCFVHTFHLPWTFLFFYFKEFFLFLLLCCLFYGINDFFYFSQDSLLSESDSELDWLKGRQRGGKKRNVQNTGIARRRQQQRSQTGSWPLCTLCQMCLVAGLLCGVHYSSTSLNQSFCCDLSSFANVLKWPYKFWQFWEVFFSPGIYPLSPTMKKSLTDLSKVQQHFQKCARSFCILLTADTCWTGLHLSLLPERSKKELSMYVAICKITWRLHS